MLSLKELRERKANTVSLRLRLTRGTIWNLIATVFNQGSESGTDTSFVNQHQETGLVVPSKDAKALAGAINYLFVNPEVREKFGEAARERVEKYFCLDRMVEDVIRTYKDIQP